MAESSPPNALRLFLALRPDPLAREALAVHARYWTWGAQSVPHVPQDWHLTLHFIGPVPQTQCDALANALDVPMAPFELSFGEAALWPHGVAVLLPLAMPHALLQLQAQLGERLRAQGLRTDTRPYRPHITLARHAQQAQPPAPNLVPPWRWPVCSYALMASNPLPAPARYRVLRQYGAVPA